MANSFRCQPFAAEQIAELWKYRLGPYIVDQMFNDAEWLTLNGRNKHHT